MWPSKQKMEGRDNQIVSYLQWNKSMQRNHMFIVGNQWCKYQYQNRQHAFVSIYHVPFSKISLYLIKCFYNFDMSNNAVMNMGIRCTFTSSFTVYIFI